MKFQEMIAVANVQFSERIRNDKYVNFLIHTISGYVWQSKLWHIFQLKYDFECMNLANGSQSKFT